MEDRPVSHRADSDGDLVGSSYSRRPQNVFGDARRSERATLARSGGYRASRPTDADSCTAAGCRDGEGPFVEVERTTGETRVLCYDCALGWMRR